MLKKLLDMTLNTGLYFHSLLKPTSSDLRVRRRVRDETFRPPRDRACLCTSTQSARVDCRRPRGESHGEPYSSVVGNRWVAHDSAISLNTNRSAQSKTLVYFKNY